MRKFKLFVMAAVFSAFLVPNQSFAELVTLWPDAINITNVDSSGDPYGYGHKASDGSLFIYYDVVSGSDPNQGSEQSVYLQKIDKNGQMLWGEPGKLVDKGYNHSQVVDLAPDQNGGAVAVWKRTVDSGTSELRAKRFDSSGNEDLSWGADGVFISSDFSLHNNQAVSDGAGGVVVVWRGSGLGIYTQRVGSDGQLKRNNGEPVFVGTGSLYHGWTQANNAVPDGNGGVFIAWDGRDSNNKEVVLVQHIDSNGSPQWPYGGLVATPSTSDGVSANDIIPDGTGGVIISCYTTFTVIVQRIDSYGNLLWGSGGIILKDTLYAPFSVRISFMEPVGNGEFVVVWDGEGYDGVSWFGPDVYAQKIDLNGNQMWNPEGIILTEVDQFDFFPHITTDGGNGVWVSFINGEVHGPNTYIGVQHLDNAGNVFACSPLMQIVHNDRETWGHSILTDDEGGVYSVWGGSGMNGNNIYAQRFGKVGTRQICGAIPVTIDIKPGEYPNVINLNSRGTVPVAVFTTDDFDVATIDVGTVIFAGASVVNSGFEDVDGDGRMDMVFHFHTQDLQLDPSSTTATLTGKTLDGIDFIGEDSVVIQ
jgi:hypothetical protein